MQNNLIKTVVIVASGLLMSSANAQQMDSATYKKTLIQFYKQQTTGNRSYTYKAQEHSKLDQDTLFANALEWRKYNIEYPMILNYLKIKQNTTEAEAKIKYLEDPLNVKEREQIVSKATESLVEEKRMGKNKGYVSPGLSTPSTPGKIENHDKEIKDKVLKNWKF